MAVLGRGAVSYQPSSPLHKMDCVSRYRDPTSCCAPRVFGGCETLPPRPDPESFENPMVPLPCLLIVTSAVRHGPVNYSQVDGCT